MHARLSGLLLLVAVCSLACGGGTWYKRYGIKDEKELRTYRALPGLEKALLKGSCYDLANASEALQAIGERAYTIQEAMQRALVRDGCRMGQRKPLAEAVGMLGDRAFEFLHGLAGDEAPDTRILGVLGLGRMTTAPGRVVPVLLARAASEDPRDATGARLAAVESLGRFGRGAEGAIPTLILLLEVEDVQEAAVRSLGAMGLPDPRTLAALHALAAARAPDDELRALAIETLEKLKPGAAADLKPADPPVKSL